MLDKFREKVKNDGNTVDFFADLNSLKYVASQTFSNAIDYADDNAVKEMFTQLGNRITDLENNQLTWEEIPTVTKEDIDKLFQEEDTAVVGKDDVGSVPVCLVNRSWQMTQKENQ